jgi:aspartyl protease family protein
MDMKRFFTVLACLTELVCLTGWTSLPKSAFAQEGSCFMVNSSGTTIDLTRLCSNSPTDSPTAKGVFTAPIKRRESGIPVIDVTFNNFKRFEMVVDTGASSTMITRSMASTLGVVPVKTIKANTASAVGVEFPVGYVQSIAVDGAVAAQVPVMIAGPDQDMGLLGHDFFGNYDVTIKQNVVEFRRR